MEFRRANNAELLGLSVGGSRSGISLRGGNGGGDLSSLGGRIGAFGACFVYIFSKLYFLVLYQTIIFNNIHISRAGQS